MSTRMGFNIAINIKHRIKRIRELSLIYEIIVCKICIITSFILANKTFDKRYSKLEFVTHKVHILFHLCKFHSFGFYFSIFFFSRRINEFLRLAFNIRKS